MSDSFGACPTTGPYDRIVLGHGSGGRLSEQLLRDVFLAGLGAEGPDALEDAAMLPEVPAGARLALTTDSFVVSPLFFPGGDIGSLAVHGTVNDLAVSGATPLHLSAAFVLEEGLPLSDLARIVASMREAAAEANVRIVTGDTKVVERGKGDGVFITTTGVGIVPPGRALSVKNARPGDRVLVSGTIGDHGITILTAREGLHLETALQSDSASVAPLCQALLEACSGVRFLRDPTRGGIASTLSELARASEVGIAIDERALPLRDAVRGACELLGLDPLHVANEGKLVAVIAPEDEKRALDVLRSHPLGHDAVPIGDVLADHAGTVTLRSAIGGERVVAMLAGEQLPRIC